MSEAPAVIDLLVENGTVVTMNDDGETIADGALAIDDGCIVEVGTAADLAARYRPAERLDARGGLILPGLIDAHVHPGLQLAARAMVKRDWTTMGALSGPGRLSEFMTIYSRLDRGELDEEQTYAAARLALLAGLKAGMTCFSDGAIGNPDGIARAALDLGLRGIVTHARSQDIGWEPNDAADKPRRVDDTDKVLENAAATVARLNGAGGGRLRGWYNWGTEVGASDELIRGTKALADRDGVGISSHTSAAGNQDALSLAIHGKRGVERLADLGALGPNWTGIHMGWLTPDEVKLMAGSGATVVHCPGTSSGSGKGIIGRRGILALREAGVPVALGSDSAGSGAILDQLRLAFFGHKEATSDDRVLSPMELLTMATRTAAKVLLWDDEIGQLAPGYRGDVTVIDTDNARFATVPDPLLALVRVASPDDVAAVVVDGRVLVRDGAVAGVDEAAVIAEGRAAMAAFAP